MAAVLTSGVASCPPLLPAGRVSATSCHSASILLISRFESCAAKWRSVTVALPPVGTGWFEVVYLDEELRVAKDSRGDLQICRRGA